VDRMWVARSTSPTAIVAPREALDSCRAMAVSYSAGYSPGVQGFVRNLKSLRSGIGPWSAMKSRRSATRLQRGSPASLQRGLGRRTGCATTLDNWNALISDQEAVVEQIYRQGQHQ